MHRSAREHFLAVVVLACTAGLIAYLLGGRQTIVHHRTAASTARAATTLPAGHTEHDYRRALLEFNRRTLVDAYRAVGHRNKRWDANAQTFLEAMSIYFSYSGASRHYASPAAPSMEELIRLSDAAILNTGCDDPLLGYCYAVLLHDTLRIDAAEPVLSKMAERLHRSAYPMHRAQAAWGRLHRLRRENATYAGAPAALERAYEGIVRIVTQKEFPGIDRRIHFEHVKDELAAGSINRQAQLIDRLSKEPGADPWLFNMLAGEYRINAAWAARGRGPGATVAPKAWGSFESHLRAARDHLVAAWELDPTSPEPAASMIRVAMGAGGELGESPREWFDRAVSAQIDYGPAYSSYLWNLRPRWNGSHAQMYAFGAECLLSDRFDTRIPFQFIYAMERIADDIGDGRYWRRSGAYDHATSFFERQLAAGTTPKERRWYGTYHAAVAWRNDRFDDVRRLLDEAGEDPPTEGFDRMNVIGRLAMSQAYAMTGPHAADASRAETLLAGRDDADAIDQAAAIYRELTAKVAPADRGAAFIRGRAAELAWRRKYDAGEWVDIQPDRQLTGWWSLDGQWHVDDLGRLTGNFTDPNQRLICQAGFVGEDYEMAGVLEFPTDVKAAPLGGPIFAHTSAYYSFGLFCHRRTGEVGLNAGMNRMDQKRLSDLPDRCEFLVQVRGGMLTAEVNGEPAYRQHDLRDNLSIAPKRYVGVSGFTSRANSVRFSKLRLRKLGSDGLRERPAPDFAPEPSEPHPALLLSLSE